MIEDSTDILLVEDNSDDADLVLRALSRSHLANRIQVARDGQEALDFLFHQGAFATRPETPRPLLVILDLSLPRIDGLTVLRTIKANPHTSRVAVIVLTGSSSDADFSAATQFGADAFMEKPITFDKLRPVMKKLGFSLLVLSPEPSLTC